MLIPWKQIRKGLLVAAPLLAGIGAAIPALAQKGGAPVAASPGAGSSLPSPDQGAAGNFWEGAKAQSVGLSSKTDGNKSGSNYRWANVQIHGGGFVTGIVFHPAERGLVYLRTDVGGAFRWDDSGRRWVPLLDGLGHEAEQLRGVESLAVDPGNPALLYAATGQYLPAWAHAAALLRSDDRGESWQAIALPFKLGGNSDGRSTGERLQVDPHKGSVLLLGTNQDGLWQSSDFAKSWSRVGAFLASGVTFVLFDGRGGSAGQATSTIYAGTDGSGVLRSTDGGASWSPLPGQPAGLIPHHGAIDAAGTLYLSYGDALGPNGLSSGAVWKYDTASAQWSNITPVAPAGEDKFGYAGLALDPRHPGTLLVSTLDRWVAGDQIFRSVDGGHSWTALGGKAKYDSSATPWVNSYSGGAVKVMGHWIGAIAINPFDSNDAIYVTGYGIWRSSNLAAADSGAPTEWTFSDDGLEEVAITELASPPKGPPLFSAIGDIGGFRHDDLQVSGPAYFMPFGASNQSLDFAENDPDHLVRTADHGAHGYYSADGGASWSAFAAPPPTVPTQNSGAGRIAIAADGARIVWIPAKSAPYYSADGGKSWVKSSGLFQVSDRLLPLSDRVNPARFYIQDLGNGVIYNSADGGASFAPVRRLSEGGGRMRAVPGHEADLWVPAGDALLRSTDGGANFSQIPDVQSAYAIGFGKAAPGASYPAVFLYGEVKGVEGVFRSDDEGKKWLRLNDDAHRYTQIDVVAGDPRVFGRVYLGTNGRGILYGDIGTTAGR